VAQPGSAPALGAGGRQFKSDRPDHNRIEIQPVEASLFSFLSLMPHATRHRFVS
jgi:hypothetical protein